jgi:ubiquitin C-terminal hydrolase
MNRRRGINNSGNECFINSTLQCLAVSPFILEFIDYYSSNDAKIISIINKYELGKFNSNEINIECDKLLQNNESSDVKINIPKEDIEILQYISKNSNLFYIYISFKEIIKNLNNGSSESIDNSLFLSINKEISSYYNFDYLFSGEQNDPHELMAYLLDKIHDSKKTITRISEPKDIDTLDVYTKLYYLNYKKRYENDYSLFVKNFYYYILNCVQCNQCKNNTHDACPSDILCVSIPNELQDTKKSNDINIYDCLNDMFKIENIQYTCEKCNNTENNVIQKKIMVTPKTLIIKIKRYYSIGKRLIKNNKFIKYPLILDMMPYIICQESQKYELYGIINHTGVLDFGHYFSYIRKYNRKEKKFNNQWYCCNDSKINEITNDEALSSQNAYILFYHFIE